LVTIEVVALVIDVFVNRKEGTGPAKNRFRTIVPEKPFANEASVIVVDPAVKVGLVKVVALPTAPNAPTLIVA
jgi:hypothetical protein